MPPEHAEVRRFHEIDGMRASLSESFGGPVAPVGALREVKAKGAAAGIKRRLEQARTVGTADLSTMRLFELRDRLCPPYARAANSDYVIPSSSTTRPAADGFARNGDFV
jgi:hypothetical protein